MRPRVFEDADERRDTVVHINYLANREAGILVAHAPPRGFEAALPQDVLGALGHRRGARNWPRTAESAWRLARAWMAGFETRHVIVYGAWRLTDRLADALLDVARDDGVNVSVVNLSTMRRALPSALGDVEVEPVAVLLDEVAASRSSFLAGDTAAASCLPAGLPALPAAGATTFRSECSAAIADAELSYRFRWAFDAIVADRLGELEDATEIEHVVDAVEQAIRRARDGNELLAQLRGLQVAGLNAGWYIDIPLGETSIAAALALNTAADNHLDWPLRSDVSPQAQALAAVAWATKGSSAELASLRVGDVDPCKWTCRERAIPSALRPAVRAQLWQRRRDAAADNDWLFTARNGKQLRVPSVRAMLDATAPAAFAASELGSDKLRRELAGLVKIVRIDTDGVANLNADDQRSPSVLPSADYGDWILSHGGAELEARTGLPDERCNDFFTGLPHGHANALAAATGTHHLRGWPQPSKQWSARRGRVPSDASRLHAVLLRTGGSADRLSLIHGLRWSAARLERAQDELRKLLSGSAEVLAATLDGRLELRVCSDGDTRLAVAHVLRSAGDENRLSTAAARVLFELLRAPSYRVVISDVAMPDDVAHAAILELRSRDLIVVREGALVELARLARDSLAAEHECHATATAVWSAPTDPD